MLDLTPVMTPIAAMLKREAPQDVTQPIDFEDAAAGG